MLDLVFWRRSGETFASQIPREFYISFSRTDSGLCIYHLWVWWNFSFLYNTRWINLPFQSYLILCCFSVSLLHSIVMWLFVDQFLLWYNYSFWHYTTIKRDSVSSLTFPFLRHVQVIQVYSLPCLWGERKCPLCRSWCVGLWHRSNQSRTSIVHFWTNTFEQGMNALIPPSQLWVKLPHYSSSTRMVLTLNNPQRLKGHWTKKPNQIKFQFVARSM